MLDLNQVPFVNRCLYVVCDKKARNFFALQYHPTVRMQHYVQLSPSQFFIQMHTYLNENISKSDNNNVFNPYGYMDPFEAKKSHDIELKYNSRTFCLNKFILLSRSLKFFEKLNLLEDNVSRGSFDLETYLGRKFNVASIELLIRYVYTGWCDVEVARGCLKLSKVLSEASFLKFLGEFKDLSVDKFGFKELKPALDQNIYVKQIKEVDLNSKSNEERLGNI